jgi:hypothetical protein
MASDVIDMAEAENLLLLGQFQHHGGGALGVLAVFQRSGRSLPLAPSRPTATGMWNGGWSGLPRCDRMMSKLRLTAS